MLDMGTLRGIEVTCKLYLKSCPKVMKREILGRFFIFEIFSLIRRDLGKKILFFPLLGLKTCELSQKKYKIMLAIFQKMKIVV